MKSNAEELRRFWKTTLTAKQDQQYSRDEQEEVDTCAGMQIPAAMAEKSYPLYDEEGVFATTDESFVALTQKIPLAKAGGEDGEATPYPQLRRPTSHGFRSGFQAAELVLLLRTLHEKVRGVEPRFLPLQA